jgi:glucose-6-phosphate isomerase
MRFQLGDQRRAAQKIKIRRRSFRYHVSRIAPPNPDAIHDGKNDRPLRLSEDFMRSKSFHKDPADRYHSQFENRLTRLVSPTLQPNTEHGNSKTPNIRMDIHRHVEGESILVKICVGGIKILTLTKPARSPETMTRIRPISFDPEGCFIEDHGITPQQVDSFAPRLLDLRDEILKVDLPLYLAGTCPFNKQPLDAGFLELPERLLAAYYENRGTSELGQTLDAAERIRETVDRVVVLGIGGSYTGTRALMECCCQPYFNEYSRAERGGRPRMYFEGNNVDNDWSQGLLQLLRSDPKPWAIVVISKSGGTLETAVAFRQFLDALRNAVGPRRLPDLVIPITSATGQLALLANAIGCRDRFQVPEGVGGRFSVFSAVGLVPAAILGIDIVRLLEAAASVNDRFRAAEPGENPVLDYVAVNHLMERECGCHTRILSMWTKSLEAAGYWHDQLLAESLGKNSLGALPLTVVNTRDLHSRAQQHQEGRRDKIINNVIVDHWRCDELAVGESDFDQDGLNEIAECTLPQIMTAAIRGTNLAYRQDGRPTTNIHLPAANEEGLGQLFQLLMLATVVEGRLIGVNPYGQPGVESYKQYMKEFLRQSATGKTQPPGAKK